MVVGHNVRRVELLGAQPHRPLLTGEQPVGTDPESGWIGGHRVVLDPAARPADAAELVARAERGVPPDLPAVRAHRSAMVPAVAGSLIVAGVRPIRRAHGGQPARTSDTSSCREALEPVDQLLPEPGGRPVLDRIAGALGLPHVVGPVPAEQLVAEQPVRGGGQAPLAEGNSPSSIGSKRLSHFLWTKTTSVAFGS